jgi:hypothetical protein
MKSGTAPEHFKRAKHPKNPPEIHDEARRRSAPEYRRENRAQNPAPMQTGILYPKPAQTPAGSAKASGKIDGTRKRRNRRPTEPRNGREPNKYPRKHKNGIQSEILKRPTKAGQTAEPARKNGFSENFMWPVILGTDFHAAEQKF